MSLALVAAMLALMARCAIDTTAQFSESTRALEEMAGIYIDERSSAPCDVRVMNGSGGAAVRAVSVVYHSHTLTLRVVPTNAVRVLHLLKEPVLSTQSPRFRHNGLARWIDGELVVESSVPALPLWSGLELPGTAATLLEAFSFSKMSLSYRATYVSERGASIGNPLKLTLSKCGAAHKDE